VLVAVLFSLVGLLILVSFRLNWHPFAFYYTK
jgi:preprotein translocase subunit SecF